MGKTVVLVRVLNSRMTFKRTFQRIPEQRPTHGDLCRLLFILFKWNLLCQGNWRPCLYARMKCFMSVVSEGNIPNMLLKHLTRKRSIYFCCLLQARCRWRSLGANSNQVDLNSWQMSACVFPSVNGAGNTRGVGLLTWQMVLRQGTIRANDKCIYFQSLEFAQDMSTKGRG